MNVLCFSVVFSIFLHEVRPEDLENNVIDKVPPVKEVAARLVKALGVDMNNDTTKRFQDLREKLDKISSYVIDKDKYTELLYNETKDNNLTHINFYLALKEDDQFQYLFEKDPKNLYLKLKEKMNRDDMLKILADNKESSLSQSARRMMENEIPQSQDDEIDYELDKFIAVKAEDTHHFDENDIDQLYWDPQPELEDQLAPTRRIYKGERTTVRAYPFMVSIHVMKRFWCGGVLYWHDLVITSASCLQLMHNNRFFRENPRALTVRVGSNHSRIGGQMIEAQEVYFHPSYNPRTLKNNIAVIRLRYQLIFNYHRLPKIIRISHTNLLVPYTSSVLLLGWGVVRATNKMRFEPIFMQRKVLPVYPNKFCQEVYGDKFVTEHMFCAGTMTTGEGACDHDAGGPAILNGRLVGVISYGPTVCGFPNAPTVFTLVGAFSDWIETVNESMPTYYRAFKKTTLAKPSTFDLRSIKAMLIASTEKTVEPVLDTRTPIKEVPPPLQVRNPPNDWALTTTENPLRDQEGEKLEKTNVFVDQQENQKAPDNLPDTRTNMPMEFILPVIESTKRSHKGHHHGRQTNNEENIVTQKAKLENPFFPGPELQEPANEPEKVQKVHNKIKKRFKKRHHRD